MAFYTYQFWIEDLGNILSSMPDSVRLKQHWRKGDDYSTPSGVIARRESYLCVEFDCSKEFESSTMFVLSMIKKLKCENGVNFRSVISLNLSAEADFFNVEEAILESVTASGARFFVRLY